MPVHAIDVAAGCKKSLPQNIDYRVELITQNRTNEKPPLYPANDGQIIPHAQRRLSKLLN